MRAEKFIQLPQIDTPGYGHGGVGTGPGSHVDENHGALWNIRLRRALVPAVLIVAAAGQPSRNPHNGAVIDVHAADGQIH